MTSLLFILLQRIQLYIFKEVYFKTKKVLVLLIGRKVSFRLNKYFSEREYAKFNL